MMFKSETPGRLDGKIFKRNSRFPEDDIMVRNEKIIAKSTGDYQSVVKSCRDQETLFANPLSLFGQLKKLHVNSLEDQYHLLHTLKQSYSHWPDGRPVEQLFPQS